MRKRRCVLIVGLVVIATSLSASLSAAEVVGAANGQAGEPLVELDHANDGAAAGVKLQLIPSGLSLNRSINFDDAGEPQLRQNQLSANFRCFYETQDTVLSYRDLEITSVITNAGETLAVDPKLQRRNAPNIRPDRQRNGRPYFDLYLNLPAPTRTAESIRELRGRITIELSRGPERVLRLSPISDYVGKRFRVTDMDDSPMSIKRIEARGNQPAMIEWSHARAIEHLVQNIKFYRRNGVELQAVARGGGGGDTSMRSRRFGIDALQDTAMVVRLFRQTRAVVVPFVVRDVPLPAAEPGGPRFDLAIATEALGQAGPGINAPAAEAAGGPAGVMQPGENDLPILIIED